MSTTNPPTAWKELTDRRKEILEAIEDQWDVGEKFRTAGVNQELADDNQTTTGLLTDLDEEDNYLQRVQTGGGPLLVAYIQGEDNKTATSPSKQKRLAQKMVNKENLSLDPGNYDWGSPNRKKFVMEFNKRSTNVNLNATWTCNYYELTPDGDNTIKKN